MTALPEVVLPLAVGGALVAGVSVTGEGRISLTGRGWTGRRHPDPARGARWARRRDLRPLQVAPEGAPPGRLLLGVLPGVARLTGLAGETAQSLVVVGPTQSGKTTSLAVPAILGWKGPVVAASVKSDLLRHTLGTRAHLGQVWCIDPTGSTGARASTWSPLTGCGEWRAACRASAELCEAAKSEGTTADGEFWYATASKLLAPLFVAAALDGRTMADVVRWVDTQEVGEVAAILERGRAGRGAARGGGDLVPRRTHPQLHLHHGRDGARSLRPSAARPADGRGVRARCAAGRRPHALPLCAGPRPTPAARVLHGADPVGPGARVLHRHQVRTTTRSTSARRTGRGGAHRPSARSWTDSLRPARRTGSRSSRSGRTWRRSGARYGARAPTVLNNHRAKLFLPGHRRPRHAGIRQPAHRGRGGLPALGDA